MDIYEAHAFSKTNSRAKASINYHAKPKNHSGISCLLSYYNMNNCCGAETVATLSA